MRLMMLMVLLGMSCGPAADTTPCPLRCGGCCASSSPVAACVEYQQQNKYVCGRGGNVCGVCAADEACLPTGCTKL